MPTQDVQEGVRALVPMFAAPLPTEDPLPEGATVSRPEDSPAPTPDRRRLDPLQVARRLIQGSESPAAAGPNTAGTRTGTSSDGDAPRSTPPSATDLAKAAAGILGMVGAGVAYLVRRTRRRELRQPTQQQLDDFAKPLARVLLRHTDVSVLHPSLLDIITAGNVVGNYVNDGPLTTPGRNYDPGVPPDLNGDPE